MVCRFVFALVFCSLAAHAALVITPKESARQWAISEFSVSGAPAASNPFDPDQITIRATFVAPSGATNIVEGFWFQDYRSSLNGSSEVLAAMGAPGWRLRFTPEEAGPYQLAVDAITPSTTVSGGLNFTVAEAASTNRFQGVPKIAPNKRYFEVAGEPLVFNGANVCWPGGRGTFDYLDWFPAMDRNGENFARLWMCPWAFGIEAEPTTQTNYNLRHAWQLDRVMRIAETNNIWVMLCLEYHGMFQTVTDQFGGNDAWKNNPYNSANGGPCAAPNDFFTQTAPRDIYKKRLRYLIARWGASPNLFCWELFNEIDNSYNNLNAASVASWHNALGTWLKQNDPYKRLVSTSLTGSSDRAEIWNLAAMEFAQFHSYGQPQPASKLPAILQNMMTKYRKPVFMSEYGIDSSGFHAEKDPYFRGLRQGVWAGLLGGAPGTGMSWWWEEIHSRNLYGLYNSAAEFLKKTALGQGTWDPIAFVTNGDPPATVGDEIPGQPLFTATLDLNEQWGFRSGGAMALPTADAAGRAPAILNGFFHGTSHSELRNLCRISAWIGAGGKLVMHLNSVSAGAIMNVRVDGASVFTQSVPNLDGKTDVNNEYNRDYTVNLTAGKHLIEVRNAGADWFFLDSLRFENVQPATYSGSWTESPVAIGLKSPAEALVYVVNPAVNFPAKATILNAGQLINGSIRLTNWNDGSFTAIWHNAKTFQPLGKTSGVTTNRVLQLSLPDFSEEIVGRIIPENRVEIQKTSEALSLLLSNPAPANSEIESTLDFSSWQSLTSVPFAAQTVAAPEGAESQFFRLHTEE